MKKSLFFLCVILVSKFSFAQQPAPLIWGVSPYANDLFRTDTLTWQTPPPIHPSITGSVISGMNGIAYDPTTYKSYIIAKIGSSRYLAEINLATGNATVMGNLGDSFSSITFDENGQLWGATGDGANNPESLYMINKTTASNTLVFAMGNGSYGEVICYNRFDDKMYHWSGDGTVVMESWPITNTSYAPTNISTSGNLNGEIFGAMCLRPNDFIVANIASEYQHVSATGIFDSGNMNPDYFRGIIMPPRFAMSPTTAICSTVTPVNIYSNCLQLYDSVYYYWGDGSVTQLLASSSSTAPAPHTYSTPGTYTVTVMLYNGAVPKSAIQTFTVNFASVPVVNISGSNTLCPGGSVTLTASGGGSSQWYKSGVAIPNATLTTYNVTSPGWYNMTKTNLSGCTDSSATGFVVTEATGATVSVSNGTICEGDSFTITPSGADTYTVTGGQMIVTPLVTTSYSVTGTSTAGCVSNNTAVAQVSVIPPPVVSITSSTNSICTGNSVTLTLGGASQYTWQSSNNSSLVTTSSTDVVTPATTTSYTLTGEDTDGCVSVNTAVATVTVNALPDVEVISTLSVVCTGESATLTASGAAEYSWTNGPTTSTIAVTPTTKTTYTVTGTSAEGCSQTATIEQDVTDCSGIRESQLVTAIRLIPNPTSGKFVVDNTSDKMKIEVYDAVGKLVITTAASSGNALVDVTGENAGVYFIRVVENNKLVGQAKLIKD